LRSILTSLEQAGIGTILALRGDPPKGDSTFKPHPDGFAHGNELIAFIKQNFSFRIGCAFYPEKHVEALDLDTDISHLKAKQEAGADFAVSQLFFDNTLFFRFREKAVARGIHLPLVCGIMPVVDAKQLPRFQELSGCSIPDSLTTQISHATDPIQAGVDFATQQCLELLKEGVSGLHLYCLNRATSILRITENLRTAGYFPIPS
jgi:methylenetetrahydrofolate reductase (NADPH)